MTPLLPKVLLSGFFACIYGLMSYFVFWDLPDAWRWALISGLGSFSLLLLMMLLRDERQARRLKKAETLLPSQPSFMVGANIREGRRMISLRVYLCGNEMILMNVSRPEPEMTRIRKTEMRRVEATSPVELRLTFIGGRELLLLSPYMEELSHQLRMQGWIILENHD